MTPANKLTVILNRKLTNRSGGVRDSPAMLRADLFSLHLGGGVGA